MSSSHSRQDTINALNMDAIMNRLFIEPCLGLGYPNELVKIQNLYKAQCINWTGKTNDTHEFYTEVIAQELLNNKKVFENIKPVSRTSSSYFRDTHSKIEIDIANSNRHEENFAKRITGLELDNLGLIIDFQIPLKDTLGDAGLGKIDLISFKKDVNTLFLIELKYIGNKETLLRALLESYTYSKIVDQNKLKKDCSDKYFNSKSHDKIIIKPAVLLIPPDCTAYNELKEIENNKRPMLKDLTLVLDVNIFTLELSVYAPKF
jgi:hypothetical protein